MKANELMIGDLVKCGKRYMKVTQLAEDMDCDDIAPIPLTPEILEKNWFRHGDGFEKRWYDVKIEDKKVTLYQSNIFYTLMIDEGIWPKLNNIYIRFVHELQHALRLCGIEKDIEL